MILAEILVPLLNANEPEARLVSIHVKEGQAVTKGTLLFTIETTKASTDVEATENGYVRLLATEGDVLEVGERLAAITESADERIELLPPKKMENAAPHGSDEGLRITQPARKLAQSLGVDLATLPTNVLVTEAMVRKYAKKETEPLTLPPTDKPYILIFGAGGHAKAIMDMVRQLGLYSIAGIVDDNGSLQGSQVLGIPVLGTRERLTELTAQGVALAANGVGGILDITIRVRIFELLEQAGLSFPVLVHPRATAEPSTRIEAGVQVFANAYVGSEAVLHERCMVNTNAVVSHDCEVGAYSHIAPGALLAGHVHVGERTLIGMGVTTSIGVRIGSGVRVGNGAILLADVPDKTIIQAGRFWTGRAEAAR